MTGRPAGSVVGGVIILCVIFLLGCAFGFCIALVGTSIAT